MPSPEIVLDTLFAYQRSAALRAAIDLEVFTAIDEGSHTAANIAKRSKSAERGIRILCDYLTIIGLLAKADGVYQLTPDAAAFLSKKSPMYLGTTAQFLTLPEMKKNFDSITETVRRGGVAPTGNTVADENPIWVDFARSMAPLMMPAGHAIAGMVAGPDAGAIRVLDIAAGHGMFGVIIAQHNPKAEIVAVDWKPVLAVAEENARAAGVQSRYTTLAGDAFKVDFGTGYDVVLVPNFLHHFDHATCTTFLKKCHAALKPGGKVVVVEFVPNADRVSPPMAAAFSLAMLAGTPSGDAYTMAELEKQLSDAGFSNISSHALPTPETILLAQK
jgi:2-polyprenyl-3-methyl-5-hydroxy-6-metoxy-1,4-benzoquinol methylase